MLGILGFVMIVGYVVTDVEALLLGAIFMWIMDVVDSRRF